MPFWLDITRPCDDFLDRRGPYWSLIQAMKTAQGVLVPGSENLSWTINDQECLAVAHSSATSVYRFTVRWSDLNTHHAYVERDGEYLFVASGTEQHCRQVLAQRLTDHPEYAGHIYLVGEGE